jgi:hypothetical protein
VDGVRYKASVDDGDDSFDWLACRYLMSCLVHVLFQKIILTLGRRRDF